VFGNETKGKNSKKARKDHPRKTDQSKIYFEIFKLEKGVGRLSEGNPPQKLEPKNPEGRDCPEKKNDFWRTGFQNQEPPKQLASQGRISRRHREGKGK